MAPEFRVVRFALAHDKNSHVLVAVSSTQADSSEPLDLKLLATDDQKAYVMTRKLFIHSFPDLFTTGGPVDLASGIGLHLHSALFHKVMTNARASLPFLAQLPSHQKPATIIILQYHPPVFAFYTYSFHPPPTRHAHPDVDRIWVCG